MPACGAAVWLARRRAANGGARGKAASAAGKAFNRGDGPVLRKDRRAKCRDRNEEACTSGRVLEPARWTAARQQTISAGSRKGVERRCELTCSLARWRRRARPGGAGVAVRNQERREPGHWTPARAQIRRDQGDPSTTRQGGEVSRGRSSSRFSSVAPPRQPGTRAGIRANERASELNLVLSPRPLLAALLPLAFARPWLQWTRQCHTPSDRHSLRPHFDPSTLAFTTMDSEAAWTPQSQAHAQRRKRPSKPSSDSDSKGGDSGKRVLMACLCCRKRSVDPPPPPRCASLIHVLSLSLRRKIRVRATLY